MIQVDGPTFAAIWRLSGLAVGAGWVVFALVSRENQVFLVVMVVLSMVLFGGLGAVLRRRAPADARSRLPNARPVAP